MYTLHGSRGSGSAAVEAALERVRLPFRAVRDYPERWHSDPDEATGARVRQAAGARLHQHWSVFAAQFEPCLGVDAPGALDLLASVVSKWSGARAHLRAQPPACLALLEATEKRSSVAAVFARHWPD